MNGKHRLQLVATIRAGSCWKKPCWRAGAALPRAALGDFLHNILTFIYLFGALALFIPKLDLQQSAVAGKEHTALIEVRGMIMADEEASGADNVVSSLRMRCV